MCNQIENSTEELLEHALKKMSVQAFDALLDCGVRDLTGILRLTAEDLRKVGTSPSVTTELMEIQFQLSEHATKSGRGNNETNLDDTKDKATPGKQQRAYEEATNRILDLLSGRPIPNDLTEKLPKRARNFLIHKNILTCKQLLEFHEEDLFCIPGIGTKTVFDIRGLQSKVIQRHTEFSRVSVKTVRYEKPKRQDPPRIIQKPVTPPKRSVHHPSDPADWSLLSHTLPEIFRVTFPICNVSNDDKQRTISDIGIPEADIIRLQGIVLFPEDPIESLFSITTSYLVRSSIGDEAFTIISDYLFYISGLVIPAEKAMSSTNVSDMAIYADIQTNLFKEFRIPQFPYPGLIPKSEGKNTFITWQDIAKISEQSVIERLGFTIHGLNVIKYLWQLKNQASKIEKTIFKGIPVEAYGEFEQLADAFVQIVVKNDRENMVLKGRLGLLEGRKWTLEELGQRENLTRERIRQIEKKLKYILRRRKAKKRLSFLWLALDEILTTGGGVCCVAEIADSLKKRLGWTTLPSDEALASLISVSSNYEVVWATPIRIIMPSHKCVSCTKIGPALTKAVENQETGALSFEEALGTMKDFYQCKICEKVPENIKFSNGYLHFIDDAIKEIIADKNKKVFYTQYAWAQKNDKNRLLIVETILRDAGRPMHFTEVHAEVNKDRPAHGQISKRNIHAHIERSPEPLLWDRGTYIHREYFSLPIDFIVKIENEIIRRLNDNIPYLSVSGIFALFKDDLLKNDVPSESALYSCIRESGNKKLICPKYPYVMKNVTGAQRLPVPLILEKYVLNQEGIVSHEELRNYAVETLCINEALYFATYHPNIPNLLRINRGEYLHLYQLGIEKDKLAPIIDHLIKILGKHDHVSADKLFEDKKITCKLLGISTPMLLFSLIQFLNFDQFDLSIYPQIRIADIATDKNRAAGIASEIINYICEKALPCSFAELYQYFVDELGYKQNSVHNILYTYRSILRYSEGVIVHLETLGWTENRQAALEMLAASHLNNRENANKPYGLVSYLYDYMYDKLPELPVYIPWTSTLVGELLSRNRRYRIIGTSRNAFVSAPNTYGIDSLDDLLYYILDVEYDGAANLQQFILDMREAGILKKSLTAMMLGTDSRIIINGNVVELAGLSDRVERT